MIVCADDFGLSGDINQAILDLGRNRRISAVSCMVALGGFDRAAFEALLNQADHLDIGLHVTLTDIKPLCSSPSAYSITDPDGLFVSMGSLLRRGVFGAVKAGEVAAEIRAQYQRFVDYAGRPPVYLDSHLHVHQFPGIRSGLLQFLGELDPVSGPYVRNSAMTVRKCFRQGVSPVKCLSIGAFGRSMQSMLSLSSRKTNQGFAGIYSYDGHEDYPHYLERFVAHMEGPNGILMTHPGSAEPWRAIEYRTLMRAGCLDGRINRFSFSV